MSRSHIVLLALLSVAGPAFSQQFSPVPADLVSASLPEAPSATLHALPEPSGESSSVSADDAAPAYTTFSATLGQHGDKGRPQNRPYDMEEDGTIVPLENRQPHRILGIMPNFRSVSNGVKPHPLGWKYNLNVATHQAFDYSSFIFLGLTSLSAEGLDEHPALGKGVPGFYSYTWRGLIDKTDGTFLSAFLLPSLLHEDTRFYALGHEHSIAARIVYVIDRQVIARTYSGHETPNIAGFGGKILTQYISRQYYPSSATDFSVLAEKFGYAVMRDVIFSSIREFYPDIAAHYIRKHREQIARQQALDHPQP